MKKITLLLYFSLITSFGFGQDLLSDKTLVWNTSTWGNGFGHKIYSFDPGGRTDLRIAGRNNSSIWTDILTITSAKLIGINTNSPIAPLHIVASIESNCNSILYGENPKAMGTDAKSFSPNLFLMHTKLDAYLGLHSYVYRKSATTSWTGGTVRLSSSADGSAYAQDNRYNNLNWIDFIGNGDGIDFGSINNNPTISIRGAQVGIGTICPQTALDVAGTIRAKEVKVELFSGCDFVFEKDYKLMNLNDLEKFVTTKQHLPEIASEKEMIENGLNMKEFQMKLLQKIEELTLYTIEQNKELKSLKKKVMKLESKSRKR
jgi:hypothetical protein